MPVYGANDLPDTVSRTMMDAEIAGRLKTGPVLGGQEPVHVQRRVLDAEKPAIGRIEHLGLRGPHGTVPVRVYRPSEPGSAERAALVYLHGGGFVVGSLDQFETATGSHDIPKRLDDEPRQRQEIP